MDGVVLPDFAALAKHNPWKSPEFLAQEKAKNEAIVEAEKKALRIEQAKEWEAELWVRYRNAYKTGDDRRKLHKLIDDARFCQGPMFKASCPSSWRRL